MNPALPDHETVASKRGLPGAAELWVMINDEWPKIRAILILATFSPIP